MTAGQLEGIIREDCRRWIWDHDMTAWVDALAAQGFPDAIVYTINLVSMLNPSQRVKLERFLLEKMIEKVQP